jgi:hypothetical protein
MALHLATDLIEFHLSPTCRRGMSRRLIVRYYTSDNRESATISRSDCEEKNNLTPNVARNYG